MKPSARPRANKQGEETMKWIVTKRFVAEDTYYVEADNREDALDQAENFNRFQEIIRRYKPKIKPYNEATLE